MRMHRIAATAGALLLGINTASIAQTGGELLTTSTELPPGGRYVTAGQPLIYSPGTIADVVLDSPGLTPDILAVVRTPIGDDELEEFDAELVAMELSPGFGLLFLSGPVQTITTDRLTSPTGTFESEIVSMTLLGSTAQGFVIASRESPTRASTGQTTITDLGAGLYLIESFFDVFTELSIDGGQTWIPARESTRFTVQALGVYSTSPELPPLGRYGTPGQPLSFTVPGLPEVILDGPALTPDASRAVRIPMAMDERELFNAQLVTTDVNAGLGEIILAGPVETITMDRLASTTGTFQTEIVSMTLSGESQDGAVPVLIRESEVEPSRGETTITDLGSGLYHIDSFFDVYTELSIDGGASWAPANEPLRMIVPESSLLSMLVAGCGGLLGLRCLRSRIARSRMQAGRPIHS